MPVKTLNNDQQKAKNNPPKNLMKNLPTFDIRDISIED